MHTYGIVISVTRLSKYSLFRSPYVLSYSNIIFIEEQRVLNGIITEELVIREIRIDETADDDFRGHYASLKE